MNRELVDVRRSPNLVQAAEDAARHRGLMEEYASGIGMDAASLLHDGDVISAGLDVERDWYGVDLVDGSRLYVRIGARSSADVRRVYGAILQRYREIGGASSLLGGPTHDEQDFTEGGRVSTFEGGAIYWWADIGAIELGDVSLHYTGLFCYGETDNDQFFSDSDEPYVVIGVIAPQGAPENGVPVLEASTYRTRIYEDVDAGESRPDRLELYRGRPRGLTLSTLLMEHDEEDPRIYEDAMQRSVHAAFAGVTALVSIIPVAGPIIAAVAGPLLSAVSPTVGRELSDALDMGDDAIGQSTIVLTAKEMVRLAAREPLSFNRDVAYRVESPMHEWLGASYRLYFDVRRA